MLWAAPLATRGHRKFGHPVDFRTVTNITIKPELALPSPKSVVESIPGDTAQALRYEPFHKHLQFHTATPAASGGRSAAFHGHHDSDEHKERILRRFHKTDDELPSVLVGRRSPIREGHSQALHPIRCTQLCPFNRCGQSW